MTALFVITILIQVTPHGSSTALGKCTEPSTVLLVHLMPTSWFGLVQGDTIFAPLEEVVNSLPVDRRERWERLHMLSDRRGGVAQPLIYPHPITGMLPATCKFGIQSQLYILYCSSSCYVNCLCTTGRVTYSEGTFVV